MHPPSARLALVPTLEPPDRTRLVATIRLLEREHALAVRTLAACAWTDDGAIQITSTFPDDGDETDLLIGSLGAVFRARMLDAGGHDAEIATVSERDLSPAFVAELREAVHPGTPFVAMIVDVLRPADVVHELWRLPGSRLIYGQLPDHPDRPDLALQR